MSVVWYDWRVNIYLSGNLACRLMGISRQNFYAHRKVLGVCERQSGDGFTRRCRSFRYSYPLDYLARMAARVRNERAAEFLRLYECILRCAPAMGKIENFHSEIALQMYLDRICCGKSRFLVASDEERKV